MHPTLDGAIALFEAKLQRAAAQFAARSLAEATSGQDTALGFAHRFGLLRLEDTSLESLTQQGRQRLVSRLQDENGHLVRAVRRGALGYDLNRHMAVRRALNALAGTEETSRSQPTPDKPLSGRELNGRFRKRAARPPLRLSAQPDEASRSQSRATSASRSAAMAWSLAACMAR